MAVGGWSLTIAKVAAALLEEVRSTTNSGKCTSRKTSELARGIESQLSGPWILRSVVISQTRAEVFESSYIHPWADRDILMP